MATAGAAAVGLAIAGARAIRRRSARSSGFVGNGANALCPPQGARASGRGALRVAMVAAPPPPPATPAGGVVEVSFNNAENEKYTIMSIKTANRPGLLQADINTDGSMVMDRFFITDRTGAKILDAADQSNIEVCVRTMLDYTARQKKGDEGTRHVTSYYQAAQANATSELERRKVELLHSLMDTYIKNDVLSIQESIVNHVEYTIARSRYRFDDFEAYQAASLSLRDRLIESWNDTQQYFREKDPRRVYYLSMEFLMGRSLLNCLYNLNIKNQYTEALTQLGYKMENVVTKERDPALGNGGLGRLAACFLDSMACLNIPAWGYGVRYQYGMFRQALADGFQREQPDYWLNFGNPWEIERPNIRYAVKYYGHVSVHETEGKQSFRWNAGEVVEAVAYDNPIPGWGTANTINLRLWSAKPAREFDLESFNTGDYVSAILTKQRAETISSVLYPDDRTFQGKELRLKQQHFLVSATLQDIVRRFKDKHDGDWDKFPELVTIQLNDTHPTMSIPELMRILMDENGLGWTKAWEIVTKVFAFTNHTVLPEALEKWPVDLMETLLPRHMQIIYDINWRFLQEVKSKIGEDWARISRMSIIEETEAGKLVRMATLALVACHAVNGVAAIHSEIIKNTIFKDFYALAPSKFQNKTNGVTQRRWLAFCNPPLRELITKTIGTEAWIGELGLLAGLRPHATNPAFQAEWTAVKLQAKVKLAATIKELTGVTVSTAALFDIQVKRIHEYKRQLLNILGVIHRYKLIKAMSPEARKAVVPRVVVLGGKAAPGYDMAKRIIKLVSAVGDKINRDPDVGDLLKLVFIPDYNVSLAETIVPGSELSQHISTAGTEASGTSNMKFAMNGCLIIGTMDGANVEIAEEIGKENMFIFGALAEAVPHLRTERAKFVPDPRFGAVVDMIRSGYFGWGDFFAPVCDSVVGAKGGDFYLLGNDFPSYLAAQEAVDKAYADSATWAKMSILSTAGSGKFSSDRTILEYAKDIWKIEPCKRPL